MSTISNRKYLLNHLFFFVRLFFFSISLLLLSVIHAALYSIFIVSNNLFIKEIKKKKEYYTIASGNNEGFLCDEFRNIPFFFVTFMGCKISTGGVLLRLLLVVVQFVFTISCCVIVPLLFVLDGDEPPIAAFSIFICV